MVTAVAANDAAAVARLLDAGADIDATNDKGETAFSYACANDALEVARLLHVRGADINTVDVGGGTPLDWAVCWSSHEFRDWLRSIGGVRRDSSYVEWAWPPPGITGTT
jgi:26S proteasome non-ATPase regulatory subunit 10